MLFNTAGRLLSITVSTTCMLMYFSLTHQAQAFLNKDPDVDKDVVELIRSKGYVAERYTVQTDDGYLLGTFRIPYGRIGSDRDKTTKRPVALLKTGLGTDSSQWVLNFPNQSLGFILADYGYDVWLACPRGCTYSQKNVNISTNTQRFWDFSWEEIGTKDLPAVVDFVLSHTKQKKLFLVDHSMGTTASFVFLSLRPEYNDKIHALMAMAPTANLSHTEIILKNLVPFRNAIYPILKQINYGNILSLPAVSKLLSFICTFRIIRSTTCNFFIFFGDGVESPQQYNQTRLPVYLSHVPGGGSAKQVLHYAQLIAAEQFVRFDYGRTKNLQRYGQVKPPEYPVGKISVPVAMFWSATDQVTNPADVAALRKRLPNVIEFYKVPFSPFTHLDYVVGINAHEYLYKRLLALMDCYKQT